MIEAIGGMITAVANAANPSIVIVTIVVLFLLWFVWKKEDRSEKRAERFDVFLTENTRQQAVTGRILDDLVTVVSELAKSHEQHCTEFKQALKDVDESLDEVKTEMKIHNSLHHEGISR